MPAMGSRAKESFEAGLLFAFENRTAFIVHGWVRKTPSESPPRYIPYAWNELEGNVFDLTQHDRPISRELFYRRHDISEIRLRRYPVQEAACMAIGTASYGPWDFDLFPTEEATREELIRRFGDR